MSYLGLLRQANGKKRRSKKGTKKKKKQVRQDTKKYEFSNPARNTLSSHGSRSFLLNEILDI
jgi:hypothetical protein